MAEIEIECEEIWAKYCSKLLLDVIKEIHVPEMCRRWCSNPTWRAPDEGSLKHKKRLYVDVFYCFKLFTTLSTQENVFPVFGITTVTIHIMYTVPPESSKLHEN